jgi:hypothetical protein
MMAVPLVTGPHVTTGGGQVPLSVVTHTNMLMGRMVGDADPAAATTLNGQQI